MVRSSVWVALKEDAVETHPGFQARYLDIDPLPIAAVGVGLAGAHESAFIVEPAGLGEDVAAYPCLKRTMRASSR